MKLVLIGVLLIGTTLFLRADFSSETITAINQERTAVGLGVLSSDITATQLAQEWAVHLASEKHLQHRSTDSLKSALTLYHWRGLNENLHASTSPATPAFVVDSWMHSPRHKTNLLMPRITACGIGKALGEDGLTYVVFNGIVLP